MKLIMTFLMTCILVNALTAASLSGTIIDAITGEDLIGANISVFQKDILLLGTISDINGAYQIELEAGEYEIKISYIGYEPQNRTIVLLALNDSKDLTVELEQGVILDEVIVNGFSVSVTEHVIGCGGTVTKVCELVNLAVEKSEGKDESKDCLEPTRTSFNITYYPNPTTDRLNIVLPQTTESLILRFIDGRKMLEYINLSEGIHSLDVSSYVAGTYILQAVSEGKLITKKVIITRD